MNSATKDKFSGGIKFLFFFKLSFLNQGVQLKILLVLGGKTE